MPKLVLLQLLTLLTLANGSPVLAKRMGSDLAYPLDGAPRFLDGRPLLGPSKTIRGLLISIIITSASAPLLGLDLKIGFIVGTTALEGDLIASFVKRRLGLPSAAEQRGSIRFPNRSSLC
jgi:CDP-2,3-bis-(O-geranylgeranyl)-sn-glycerol synthase